MISLVDEETQAEPIPKVIDLVKDASPHRGVSSEGRALKSQLALGHCAQRRHQEAQASCWHLCSCIQGAA